jgi:hypothetical protein
MADPLDLIEKGCRLFRLMDLKAIPKISGGLIVTDENSYYFLADETKLYHPLETILAGEKTQTGDWMADTATRLGVNSAWMKGFIDGFAQAVEHSTNQDYVQGYLAAEDLRSRHLHRLQG